MEVRVWSIVVAAVYGTALYIWQGILGNAMLDGGLGIILGLYTCSHPASYFLNLLFFERGAVAQAPGMPTGWSWAGFNVLVMIVGWLIVIVGALTMAGSTA
jgi:hypothetical protein